MLPASNRAVMVLFVLFQFVAEDLAGDLVHDIVLCAVHVHDQPASCLFTVNRRALIRVFLLRLNDCLSTVCRVSAIASRVQRRSAFFLRLRAHLFVVVLLVVRVIVSAFRLGNRVLPTVLLFVADRHRTIDTRTMRNHP